MNTKLVVKLNKYHIEAINQPKSIILMFGGSSSGKTYTVSQWLLMKLIGQEKFWAIYCRRYMMTLLRTAWRKFLQLAEEWGVLSRLKINKFERSIACGKNLIQFVPLDSEEKIKDFEVDAIFIDELSEISEDVFFQVLNRAGRSKRTERKIICASNPISATHWIIQRLWNVEFPDTYKSHSTYHCNIENLSESYINQLESYKTTHPRYYQVYCLGEPGSYEGLIYHNYEIIDSETNYNYDCFGIDFGMTNPTAIVGVKQTDDGFYVNEILYKSQVTTSELIEFLKKNRELFRGKTLYCDSAEPDRITELRIAGFNAVKSNKSVSAGIQYIAGVHLKISAGSENLRKEIENYTYKRDREGNWEDKPIEICDHAMDAMRYAIYTRFGHKPENSGSIKIITSSSSNKRINSSWRERLMYG